MTVSHTVPTLIITLRPALSVVLARQPTHISTATQVLLAPSAAACVAR